MSYLGTVQNGVVVLDPEANLPEGASVRVEPVALPAPAQSIQKEKDGDLDPVWRMGELAAPTGIPDLAVNADHYLYGHPKASDRP